MKQGLSGSQDGEKPGARPATEPPRSRSSAPTRMSCGSSVKKEALERRTERTGTNQTLSSPSSRSIDQPSPVVRKVPSVPTARAWPSGSWYFISVAVYSEGT